MKIPSNAQAVLFDMDGVIFNTEDLAHKVFTHLANVFVGVFEESDHVEILGTAESNWSNYFVSKWNLSISNKEFAGIFWENLENETKEHLKFMPGFEELIGKIKNKGLKVALVTSTPRINFNFLDKKFSLIQLFDVIVTGDEIAHGKPNPDPYLLAISRLGVAPESCVVIEDALSGVRSGKAAGCYVIAVPTKHATGLDYSDADLVVTSLNDI